MIKRRWTNNDEERLIKLLQMKVKQREIAKTLARTPAAIQNKINELKEQSVTPIKSDVRRTVIISEMGKPISVLTPEKVVVIKKKKNTVVMNTSPAPIPSKLNFSLFGEKFKVDSNKVTEFFHSLNSLGQILNKEIEIKFK